MPTVSTTVIQPQTYVRLQISFADVPSETHACITRLNTVTCETVPVRVHTAFDSSGECILLSCDGTAVLWDTEAPLETNVVYTATGLVTGLVATSGTVNIDDNGENHLKDPVNPCHDVRVAVCIGEPGCVDSDPGAFYIGHSSDVRHAKSINLLPVNAKRPIVISRQRQDPESTLVVGTQDCDDETAMVLLNDPGTPLLWQSLPQYCIPDRYISVGEYEAGQIGVDQRLQTRIHVMPYLQVERPAGPGNGPCGVRWNDLCDLFPTWDALAAAGLTWNDLLMGFASTEVPARRRWIDVETTWANWAAVEAANANWADVRELP